MKEVPFTQYPLPNGRKKSVSIEVADAVSDKAQKIIDVGLVFKCELLSNGVVSLTIADKQQEIDVAIKICYNSVGLKEAVERLITEYYDEHFDKQAD